MSPYITTYRFRTRVRWVLKSLSHTQSRIRKDPKAIPKAKKDKRKMAVALRGRNSDFDWQKQCDRSDYFSLDETHDTDQQSYDHNTAARYPQLYTEPTSQSSHGIRSTNEFEKLEANSAKNVTIPRYILLILVVIAIVTFMVCVTLLMIILLTNASEYF